MYLLYLLALCVGFYTFLSFGFSMFFKSLFRARSLLSTSFFVLILALPWLCVRVFLSVDYGIDVADIFGILSDLALASALCLALSPLQNKIKKYGFTILYLVFVFVSIGNYEHILALGSSFSFRDMHYLTDTSFVSGSIAISAKATVLLCLLPFLLFLFLRFNNSSNFSGKDVSIFLLVLLIPLLGFEKRENIESWRQSNVLIDNLMYEYRLALAKKNSDRVVASASALKLWKRITSADVSGVPVYTGDKKNILLIFVEGLSGHFVYQNDESSEYFDDIYMPKLAKIAGQSLQFSNFYAPQVQTNRGEYAMLCGDLPNIASHAPKMPIVQQVQSGLGRKCLPQHLRDNNYITSYLQAASLDFMDKDKFMPVAGFERIQGRRWFKKPYLGHAWGISDRDFFKQSLREVSYLKEQNKPWMLTLLTVGTHHPYTIPKESIVEGMNKFRNSVEHVDAVLHEYLIELEALGVMDDTLIVITSDESQGSKKDKSKLSKNWIPMVVIDGSAPNKVISEPFIQTDFSLSIMDYLGLLESTDGFQGRSIFREYSSKRPMVFGMFHEKKVYYLDTVSMLTVCDYNFTQCSAKRFSDQVIHNNLSGGVEKDVDIMKVNDLKYVVAENDWTFDRFNKSQLSLDGVTPWVGQYFTSRNFDSKVFLRQDESINFDWGQGPPIVGFPSVSFSIRWRTCLEVDKEQQYAFSLVANEGAKLFIKDEVFIDHWRGMASKKKKYMKSMEEGVYLLTLDYYEDYYHAKVALDILPDEGRELRLSQPLMDENGNFSCR